jgi:tRNA nucleotidyltransferase (CCA-adding enzyme)
VYGGGWKKSPQLKNHLQDFLLYKTGLLDIILPELTALNQVEEIEGQTHKNNFYHTLEVVDNILRMMSGCVGLPCCTILVKPNQTKQGWTFHGHEFLR